MGKLRMTRGLDEVNPNNMFRNIFSDMFFQRSRTSEKTQKFAYRIPESFAF